jgi:hypothetical protein
MQLKSILVILPVFVFASRLFAQDCSVEKESLKGTYTGECKKGKANGKGKAVGADTYEGDFKSGLPDGQGSYTWANGSTYSGKFARGKKEGKGVLIYKRTNGSDSVVDGYWKNDEYAGKYEKPYLVYFTSKSITQVEVEYKKEVFHQVTFMITNTSGGAVELSGETGKMKVDEVLMSKGSYGRMVTNNDHTKRSETILYDVVFPARMKINIGGEQVEIEFFEAGNFTVNLRINE